MVDNFTGTHILVWGRTTVFRAIWMVAEIVSALSSSVMWWGMSAAWLRVRMGNGAECHGTTFLSLRNIPRMYLSMNEFPSRASTAKFSTTLDQTWTLKSPSYTMKKIVPSSEMGFSVALRGRSNCCLFIRGIHPFLKKVLLTRFSTAPVSRTNECGWNCLALVRSFTADLYVDLGRSVTVIRAKLKPHFFANITGEDACCVRDWFCWDSGI